MSNQLKSKLISPLFFTAGLLCILWNSCGERGEFYLGGELTGKTLVLTSKPEHIRPRKGIDRYVFKAQGYSCEFRIVTGAYDIVKESAPVGYAINAMNTGDTVQVAIRYADDNLVYNDSKQVSIIGLEYNNRELISPRMVAAKDSRLYYINITIAVILLLTGIGIFIYKKFSRSASEADA